MVLDVGPSTEEDPNLPLSLVGMALCMNPSGPPLGPHLVALSREEVAGGPSAPWGESTLEDLSMVPPLSDNASMDSGPLAFGPLITTASGHLALSPGALLRPHCEGLMESQCL
ncbi:hypothetical protein BHE74_00045504 [Ensete ventricosum]|nr:hypothetical protein GW17_00044979 [Ensete ventricosum]RWW48422.1 hypothetical protein BHE74_00045504 [Ensete ventricosum]RZS19117.1 hypothetical protein BHM03_00051468 [Ensete ventricosum]